MYGEVFKVSIFNNVFFILVVGVEVECCFFIIIGNGYMGICNEVVIVINFLFVVKDFIICYSMFEVSLFIWIEGFFYFSSCVLMVAYEMLNGVYIKVLFEVYFGFFSLFLFGCNDYYIGICLGIINSSG